MTHSCNFQHWRMLGHLSCANKFEDTIHPRVRTVRGAGFKRDYAKPI